MSDDEGKFESTVETRTLDQLVNALARAVDRSLSPGDVAALRRMMPDERSTPAFWKLVGTHLANELRGDGSGALAREASWAIVINALALSAGLHAAGRSLGFALADAGYSELRLTRLLRAHADALPAEVRSVARFLSAKAEPFDATDLARLVLSDGGPSEEQVRRGIAKSFFGQLARNQQ